MHESSFDIRDHVEADVPAILHVIKTAFAEQKDLVDPPSSAERKTLEIVYKELETAKALVVETRGSIIACVFYQPLNNECYVDRLAVLPDFRKHGIATKLMSEIEKRVDDPELEYISVSVRIELKKLQAFYQNMGYEISGYGRHKGFDRNTYVNMRKPL